MTAKLASDGLMEETVGLCKRRGFISPSSEIYSGYSGVYNYGPLGVELRNNIKQAWWRDMVQRSTEFQNSLNVEAVICFLTTLSSLKCS